MKKLRHGLYSIINSSDLNSPEFRIATFLLQEIKKSEVPSITDIAEHCYVSKATVSRFCRKIGFSDYFSIKQLMSISKIPRKRRYNEFQNLSYEDAIQLFIKEEVNTLETVKNYCTKQRLDHFCDLILQHNEIASFGQTLSYSIAVYLQSELSSFEIPVVASALLPDQENYILSYGKESLVIIISSGGYYFQDYDNYIDVSQEKPYIILLTNNSGLKNVPPYDEIYVIPSENNTISRPNSIKLFLSFAMMHMKYKLDNSMRNTE